MPHPLRELLFGDLPIEQWSGDSTELPWRHFRTAADALQRDDAPAARSALHTVLATPGLESRHYLQAWDGMRQAGAEAAPQVASTLYGVVLDVPVEGGLDTLAAYADHTARYLNFSGKVLVWEVQDPDIQCLIDAVLFAGRRVLEVAGPWDGPRPPLADGLARVSLLTPQGLHFGEAPVDALLQDPVAGPVFTTGAQLMQALIAKVPGPG